MTYKYQGAQADLDGRGFLGFTQITKSDPQGNIAVSDYLTPWPYTGVPWRTELDNRGVTLPAETYGYNSGAPGAADVSQSGKGSYAQASGLNNTSVTATGTLKIDRDLRAGTHNQ